MDRVRRFIHDGLDRAGVSMADASKRLGRNQAYLHQYIYRNSPKKLTDEDRLKVAAMIGCDERLLIPDQTPPVGNLASERAMPPLRGRLGLRDLALWPGSTRGEIVPGSEDVPEAYIARIEQLLGNAGAWACRVMDDGLEPCLQSGDLAFFDPTDPVRKGDVICIVRELPDSRGRERRLGLCLDTSRDEIGLSYKVAGGLEKLRIEPHIRVGRMVGMLRR